MQPPPAIAAGGLFRRASSKGTVRAGPPGPLLSRRLKRFSVEDLPEFDPRAVVESPRSVAACVAEGIRPQDLTYVPLQAFERPEVSPEVAELRYGYFEAYRQDLLALARAARAARIQGETAPHPLSPGAFDTSPCRCTARFFREQLEAFDIKSIPCLEDWTQAPRSPEFARVDLYAAARAESPGDSVGPGVSAAFSEGSPLAARSPSATQTTWFSTTGGSWRSTVSRETLSDVLQQTRSAPGASWSELEAARRVEDMFGSFQRTKLQNMKRRHAKESKLIQKRIQALDSSFTSLVAQQQYKDRLREIREYMSPPRGAAGYSDAHERAKANIVELNQEGERQRRRCMEQRVAKQQALEIQLDEERVATRMKYAVANFEDRVRWRHNYAATVEERAADREGVLLQFRRKQDQMAAVAKRTEDATAMRKEILNLRHTHRLLDECRRNRKQEYEEEVRRQTIRDLAEKRLEETGGRISVPSTASGLGSPRAAGPPSPTGAGGRSPAPGGEARPRLTDLPPDDPLSPQELQWIQRASAGLQRGWRATRSKSVPMLHS